MPLPSFHSFDIKDLIQDVDNLLFTSPPFDASTDADGTEHANWDGVPPFPAGHKPPLFTLIDYRSRLLFPPPPYTATADGAVTLTAPTTSRLKLVLREEIHIDSWIHTLLASHPPGHIPWSGDKRTPSVSWIPDGSIFPPSKLRKPKPARRAERTISIFNPVQESSDRIRKSGSSPYREALVFEHQLTIHPLGHVPRRDQPVPSLTVSTSFSTVPVSLDSSRDVSADMPLAARRGKQVTPLCLEDILSHIDYPDMPTAFLGSPPDYIPEFEFANPPDMPLMDHHVMISSLRAKSSFQASQAKLDDRSVPDVDIPSTPEDRDDWAFTHPSQSSNKRKSMFIRPATINTLLQESQDHDVFSTSLDFDPLSYSTPTPSASIQLPATFLRPFSALTLADISPTVDSPLGRPPSQPLPACPALTPNHVRGILKKAKSVRFSTPDNEALRMLSVPAAVTTPSTIKRPSPLRQSYTIDRGETRSEPLTSPTSSSVAANTTAAPVPALSEPVPTTRKQTPQEQLHFKLNAIPQRKVSARPSDDKLPTKKATPNELAIPRRISSTTPLQPMAENTRRDKILRPCKSATFARHSVVGTVHKENETKGPALSRPARWSATSEHPTCRPVESNVQKKRKSTPLRNILTRFK